MEDKDIKKIVQERYTQAVAGPCGCGSAGGCCGSMPAADLSRKMGYTDEDLKSIPAGANLGLGCGNPLAFAALQKGDTVLDLGSGAGIDCFLAADRVGITGRVIGVDMTDAMLEKARENGRKSGYANVEFRKGEIEHLPVEDASVDVIISNCVINLSVDKKAVFSEAFRVLKPGGRIMISDIVLYKALPEELMKSSAAYTGCVSGALLKNDYLRCITAAGFVDVQVMAETSDGMEHITTMLDNPAAYLGSVKVSAVKPGKQSGNLCSGGCCSCC